MNEKDESQIVDEEEERAKANEALQELIDVLSKYKLRAQDLIVVYGNLGYSIGAGMEGYDEDEGPGAEELQQAYYTKPSVGIALMLQGMLVTSWHDQIGSASNQQQDESQEKE